ncbi:MAG TPA: hypothetical protein VIC35_10070 [Acidimicrobiia bacterium]
MSTAPALCKPAVLMAHTLRPLLAQPSFSRQVLDRVDALALEQRQLLTALRGPLSGRRYSEVRARLAAISDEIATLLPDGRERSAS